MTTASVHTPPLYPFSYDAQTSAGTRLAGTIEAADAESAMAQLVALQLRVLDLKAAAAPARAAAPPPALGRDDFLAFNQQLAQLTAAGLPVEQGLRLIAADMRRGRLRTTIDRLAGELERGVPLEQAFESFRGGFPPLYGKLIAAGVKSGNLSGVLLNLGAHLDLTQRLRAVLWRALSYPLLVFATLCVVLIVLSLVAMPQFEALFAGFRMVTPVVTDALFAVARAAPYLIGAMVLALIVVPIGWSLARRTGRVASGEAALSRLPLVGPVLRLNGVARWCDAARIAVVAGLDLPAALDLASDVTASRRLTADARALSEALSSGRPLSSVNTRYLPRTIPAALEFGSRSGDLPQTLQTLSDLYQRQASLRLNAIPGILTPILILLLAAIIGWIILALLMPFISLLRALTDPQMHFGVLIWRVVG